MGEQRMSCLCTVPVTGCNNLRTADLFFFNYELKYLVFILLGDYSESEFYLLIFRTLSVPSHIRHVNQKNNWDQYARVFIQIKVWLKRILDQLEGGGMGRGHV